MITGRIREEVRVMFAVIYRWRLHQGKEQQFASSWDRMTEKIHDHCGSYGSRLHQADDGTWVAYARWPDASARERCPGVDPEALSSMREAIAESLPEIRCHVIDDLLAEPRG
ncbi:antibiotic biosynthesis monooxygenase [Streptomyces sp. NPDC002133]|uniref:antibiotic biosynthesis monooxygenase n=1 Tax=Streptomyces sp. NPDC002133 TaxID=3154409 RepID=UPI003319267B